MPTFRKSFLPPSSGFGRFYTAVETQQRTRRNIPEHSNLHHHRCQNLSYVVQTSLRASFGIFTGFQCHELRLPDFTRYCHLRGTTLQTITWLHCFCAGQLCFLYSPSQAMFCTSAALYVRLDHRPFDVPVVFMTP
jgi:hypothetical protein